METRANYIAVGAFTLAAVFAAFVIIYWLGKFKDTENLVAIDVRIQGSVSGLGKGSSVQFNGITVGRVKGLSLDPSDPQYVIVHAELNADTPIRQDTKASIGIRGLSGGAFIALEGGDKESPNLLTSGATDGVVPLIKGQPAALADLLSRVNGIATRTESVLGSLEKFVTDNKETVSNTLSNVEVFSKSLSKNSDGVSKFMDSAGDVAVALERMSAQINGSTAKLEAILSAVDPKTVSDTVTNISKTVDEFRAVVGAVESEAINSLITDLGSAGSKVSTLIASIDSAKINSAVVSIEKAAGQAESMLSAVDKEKVNQAVNSFSAAGASAEKALAGIKPAAIGAMVNDLGTASRGASVLMKALDPAGINLAVKNISNAASGAHKVVSDVRNVTTSLGTRGDDINQMVTNASQLVARLNDSSVKINGVVERVDKMLGGGGGAGLAAEAQKTLVEIRRAARSLSVSVNRVANNVDGFTRRGLGDVQGLVSDARKSVESINRVMRNIENNPSSLITGSGGSKVRESRSSRRRH